MATAADFLAEWSGGNACSGEFHPYAEYAAEEDALTFFFRPDAYWAKRLNSRVTVYFSLDGGENEIVGCRIKSVRHVLEDIGEFDVSINGKGVRLTLVFAALRSEFVSDEDSPGRSMFREIGRAAREANAQLALD